MLAGGSGAGGLSSSCEGRCVRDVCRAVCRELLTQCWQDLGTKKIQLFQDGL